MSNWSFETAAVPAAHDLRDLFSGEVLPARTPVTLTAWDVRVVVDAQHEESPA